MIDAYSPKNVYFRGKRKCGLDLRLIHFDYRIPLRKWNYSFDREQIQRRS